MWRRIFVLSIAALAGAALAAGSAAAAVRIFSYDPTNDATRRVAGDLTFQFRQRLIFTTVLNIESTEGRAKADLRPADEHVLGRGGLSRLIGANAQERDLYEVEPSDEGRELIHAFCPGSSRAWLAFSRLVEARPLRIRVIGDDPAGGPARLCETLDFQFHGEWKLPSGPGVRERDLLQPTHGPY
jgi:hypothetical protein